MPRNPRIFATDAIYHVYCRTARGVFVFEDQGEAKRWIDTVAFVAQQDRVTIFVWCRCLVTTLTVAGLGYRAKDLAEYLDKSSVSVSRWLSEGTRLQLNDPGFRRQLRTLRKSIDSL